MNKKKRVMATLLIFLLVLSLFIFTAAIEYGRSYQNHVKKTQDQVMLIRLKLDNIIASRMIAINGLKAYVEVNPNFDQKDFEYFALGIYESSDDVVRSITFLSDTTISHIYPFLSDQSVVGTDLSFNTEQGPSIKYVKESTKTMITGPVNLVQGGIGLVVRVPVLRQNKYFGQVSIVFDFDKTLESIGLYKLSERNNIKLFKNDELDQSEKVIWTNFKAGDLKEKEMVINQVALYDSAISLTVIPKAGFKGKSLLFYFILFIGWFIATVSSIVVYRLLETTAALVRSKLDLIENNEELEAMINQLKANEEKLYIQYDAINNQKKYIEFLADSDFLTNLFNRRRFTADITKSIEADKKGTVLLFDLDNFKNINDSQGHFYGDKVLKHIGVILNESISENAVTYRVGGDEFVIHLPGVTEFEKIEDCINGFFKALKTNNCVEQIKNHITASVGIAKYPTDASSSDDLLMKSDIAMYKAKNDGKNRYCYFSNSLISNFDYNIKVEKELQDALENNKFKLLYQPIIDSKNGELSSVEALIRIQDSQLSPADFIPVAESTGLIIPIGHWVIDEVCLQLSKWQKNFNITKPVAINISVKQLYDDAILVYVEQALNKYGLSPKLLEIEITESVLIENSVHMIELLNAFRDLGIAISLDDFGTGYSSLSYLTYMPVNKVKIDKSLKDKFLFLENTAVMEGIISICHGLGMKVVTEGVETKEEYERLKAYHSDLLQGFYFEKPLEADEIIKRLDKNYLNNQNL